MQTYVTGKKINLTRKLNPADLTLYGDVDIGITGGRLYFVNNNQQEWISFTGVSASGSEFAYTGLTRGLSQTADPSTAGTGVTWLAGSIGILVAMHDQLVDKQQDNTLSGNNTFTGTDTINNIILSGDTTTVGLTVKNLTSAQRLALTPANGMLVYDTTVGELYQYIGGAWSAVSSGSTQPNASTTVAGKVEMATSTQSINATDTGETGALLSVLPSDIAKNTQSGTFLYGTDTGGDDDYVIALTPTLTTYTIGQILYAKMTTANTGACTIDFGPGVKNIKLVNGNDPGNGDVASGKIHSFQYDGTNFVLRNPAITTTTTVLHGIVKTNGSTTKNIADASTTQNIAHSLGKTPTKISIWAYYSTGNSSTDFFLKNQARTTYNGTTQTSLSMVGDGSFFQFDSNFRLCNTTGANTYQTGVVTYDATNIIITWTKTGSPTGTLTLLWEAETNN